MRSVFVIFNTFLASSTLFAQLVYNNGTDVAVTDGGVLWVDGSVENATGLFSNAGEATIRGYFRNGGVATGGGAAGEYFVSGDWENNNTFSADQSTVTLNGGNQQITGTQVTTFYDLVLEGGSSVKTQTIDANVSHFLNFKDAELATGENKMTVTTGALSAINRNSGFVSSTGAGRFVRVTNSTSAYLFPTGWNNNGTALYRPVEIAPSTASAQNFSARMGFGDASAEGYDITNTAANITAVNTKFFHLIKQSGSTDPASVYISYNPTADQNWSSIARWQSVPQWQDLGGVTTQQGTPFYKNVKSGWTDNGNEPHVLVNKREIDNLFAFPNVFNPGSGNSDNATFHIINQFDAVTLTQLRIFNRWGEPVFDSQRDGRADWDGSYQGKLQPMGNYVYQASVKINDTGEVKEVSGNLSLLW